MVKETSVIKLSAIMRKLETMYPDLKSWNYKVLYRRDKEFEDESAKRKWLALRAREIEKTTQAITSFIEMGFEDSGQYPDSYFKRLIKYYLVLMDAQKYDLNFMMAGDEIFEMVEVKEKE
jgi:hypothetical protein